MIEKEIENEKDYKFFKIILLLVQSFIIGLCVIFFIGVSRVDALTYNQRYFSSDGTIICMYNDSTSSCTNSSNNYTYSLYRLNYNSTINANNETTLLWKFVHANNFKIPTGISEDTANNLNKVSIPNIYVINTSGDAVEITDSCSGVASVKTTFTSRTNNLKQWTYTISCKYNVTTATNAIMVRVSQSSATLSPWINTIGYAQTSFSITNNPSEADQLINAFNNISADIINAIEQKQQEQINNQNNIWQEQIEFFENQYNQYNESQKVCETITITNQDIKQSGYLDGNGDIGSNENYGITDYITIDTNTQIKLTKIGSSGNAWACVYNENYTKLQCYTQLNLSVGDILTLPNNAKYIRFTLINSTNSPNWEINVCKNGNQAVSDDLNDINDTLNDSSIDNPNNALNDMNNYFGDNGVISDLLLLPVRMFQNIVNTIDGTCSPFNLGRLLGHDLIMPCINLSSRLGSALYGVIDVLISGFFILSIRKKFVDVFEHFTSLKTGGNELE